MSLRPVARPPADEEFLLLSPQIRLDFDDILPALVRHPFRSGPGFTVQQVRNHPGLWKLKLSTVPPKSFRAVFEVDGEMIRFLAFGPRPEFYRKLDDKDRRGRGKRDLLR